MGKQREEEYAETNSRRSSWSSRLAPGTFLGYAFTALSVVVVGVCIYAVSGLIRDSSGAGLAGSGTLGSGETTNSEEADGSLNLVHELFRSEAPGGGEKLRQTRTAGGAKVALVRAYADVDSVVVGYTVEDLEKERRLGEHPVELQPSGFNDFRLTDESGTEFKVVSAGGAVSPGPSNIQEGPLPQVVVFEAEGNIKPDSNHRFHLTMSLVESPVVPLEEKQLPPKPFPGNPFVFDFETPVQSAPVVEVNRKDTAKGTTLTLKRVTDSPGQPEAVVCLKSQDSMRGWFPIGRDLATVAPRPVAGEDDCLKVLLNEPLNGPSSVTVAEIMTEGKVIRGPWRFDFEMPGR